MHEFENPSFTFNEPLDGECLRAVYDSLPESLLRAKGVFYLAEEPTRRTIYQRVGKRWSYTSAESWGDETPSSNFVLIGPEGVLEWSTLDARLHACLGIQR